MGKVLLVAMLAIAFLNAGAQQFSPALKRVAVTGYNVDNGLLQNSVTHIVTDKFGFVWFCTGAGIQRFDGRHFEQVRLDSSNPSVHKGASLALLKNEEIWISHARGITAYNPETNRFRKIYTRPPAMIFYLYEYLGEDEKTVWYAAYKEAFLQFDKNTGVLLSKVAMPDYFDTGGYLFIAEKIDEKRVCIRFRTSLAVFDLQQKKVTAYYASNNSINGFIGDGKKPMIFTNSGVYNWNFEKGGLDTVNIRPPLENDALNQLVYTRQGDLLLSFDKNIYELDRLTLKIRSKLIAFNQNDLINSGFITKTYIDRFDRLWILTNSDGVKMIDLSRRNFKYYGTASRRSNFVRSMYPNKQAGEILAGTYEKGLVVFDTSGYVSAEMPGSGNEATTILDIHYLGVNNYLMLSMGSNLLCLYNSKNKKLRPIKVFNPINGNTIQSSYYGSLHLLADSSYLFVDHYMMKFSLRGSAITDTSFLRPYSLAVYNFLQTSSGYCIANDRGLELTDKKFKTLHFAPFEQQMKVRCLSADPAGNIWIGTEAGLYKANSLGKIITRYTIANGLTDDGIYAIQPSAHGIYFSHNKGISLLANSGRLVHYSKYSGLQENEFNTKSTFKTTDGELYFGGINGITAFYPADLVKQRTQPAVYITGLQVMDKQWKDTAVWNIDKIDVDYNENRLAIFLGTPAASDNASKLFEYRLDGLDPGWLNTTGVDAIRYVLPPGKYTFRARLVNSTPGSGEITLQVNVAAPFWAKRWFKLVIALAASALMFFIIHLYNRRKYLRKIKQLELEQRIQEERTRISRDLHDNLGAYATAIAENVSKLARNPADTERLQNLKSNAAEIMNNLRDSIWALNKTSISATRLSDRIKNYLQKMQESYPHIKLQVTEETNAGISLRPEYALNIVRIVQEAFHNAIKHSQGNEITFDIRLGDEIYISIKDNGKGVFSINNNGNGFGNMKARAEENNLQFRVFADPAKGTTIELSSRLH